MPNWIEGTMKLRGKREDITRFFREGLEPSNWPKPEDRENQVVENGDDEYLDFSFINEPHIIGTRRAFITDSGVDMEEDEGVVCVDVKQAWAFDAGNQTNDLQNWKDISDKFNVDIRLYGVECGMRFTQEIIIVRDKSPIVNERQYENWDWECPFSRMGG